MEISIADQIALDDALVAPADRLKIGKCNLRLSSDVTSKEATLQVVYDVLKITPLYKAFQVTADAPEIYMQELWAFAYVHNRSIRFKMNNKKHILGLDQFRDILQICPKVGNKKFEEPPLEKEILAFLDSLGHSRDIRKITDSSSLSSSNLVGFVNIKIRRKAMRLYYPRFTKLSVNFVMDKDPFNFLEERNQVGQIGTMPEMTQMFTTINVISRKEVTQMYGTSAQISITNEDIPQLREFIQRVFCYCFRNDSPKGTKGSKKKADTDTITKQKPPTVPKEVKEKNVRKRKSRKTYRIDGMVELIQDDEKAQDNADEDKNDANETTQDDEDDDKHDDDEKAQDDDDEAQTESEDDGNEAVEDTNYDLDGRDDVMTDAIFTPGFKQPQDIEDSHVTLTPVIRWSTIQSSSDIICLSPNANPNQDTGVDDIFDNILKPPL
ncbi:hypothetical protein Tco_0957476 [Tanacetum coccineum]